jgi:putative photosynthetic complex assembly protein
MGAGEGSFMRGVIRSLVRQRHGAAAAAEHPFSLDHHADGRLIVRDPQTSEFIDLVAFGPTNVAVFAAMLASAEQ